MADNTFKLVRRDLGSELNQAGARPGTSLEACVKQGRIRAAKKDLDHHIWYWEKSFLGKVRKGFEKVGDWFTGIGKKLKDGIVNGLKGLANLAMKEMLALAKPMLLKVIDSVTKKVGFTAADIKFVRDAATGKVDRKKVREVVTRRLVLQYIQPRLKAKIAKLIDRGLEKIQKPIDVVASSVVAGLGSIPFVGGVLAAGVGFAMRLGLDQLRGVVGNLITKLVMNKLIEPLIRKGVEFLRTLGSTVRKAMDAVYRRGYEFFEQYTRIPGQGGRAASGGIFAAADLSKGWKLMAGKLVQVSAGTARHVWGVAKNHSIWQWTGTTWKRVPGGLVQVSVGSDGTVWGVGPNGKLYQWGGSRWKSMPGVLSEIAVGSSKHVWGVAKDRTVWRWNGSGWDKVAGALQHVSTAADGATWGLFDGKIYRYQGKSWREIPGTLSQISVGSAKHVWGIAADGSIRRWTGSSWARVPGGLTSLSVGADGAVWGADATDTLFKRTR